jgi:hypothetical protein
MKRAIVLALSVILALVLAAPTVLAQDAGPPNGGAPEVVDTGDEPIIVNPDAVRGTCDFPLQLDLSGKAKTIVLPDGAVVGVTSIGTSPGLDVTVTNVTTGEQATFNITGAFHNSADTPKPGQVTTVTTGRSLIIDPVAGTAVIAIGNFSFVSNPDGTFAEPLEGEGQLIDVCALLA